MNDSRPGGVEPLVSVVVPTRDRPDLLTTTLRSIVRQRSVPLEVVVVDDASADSDAVPAVVEALDDGRIRIVRQSVSAGVGTARNRGLAASTGTWIAFCDDDDLWAPDKIDRQVHAVCTSGRSWAYTGAVDINRANVVTKGSPPPPRRRRPRSAPIQRRPRRLLECPGGEGRARPDGRLRRWAGTMRRLGSVAATAPRWAAGLCP